MTQHKWTTPEPESWDVLAGWDRPLQHFFLNIERVCSMCEGSGVAYDGDGRDRGDCETCHNTGTEFLFNNLEDPRFLKTLGGMSLREIVRELDKLGVEYPLDMVDMLAKEQAADVGNRITRWQRQTEAGNKVVWRASVSEERR